MTTTTELTTGLLDQLTLRVEENLFLLAGLDALPDEALQRRPHPTAWTALEALEHLNRFDRAYQKRVRQAIDAAATTATPPPFRSGWLGNWIANWARPGGKTIKLWSPKKANPRKQALDRTVVTHCITYSRQLLELIEASRQIDLTHTKVPTIETSWLKLRLGDILRLLANHDWRHIEQAERATRGLAGIRIN